MALRLALGQPWYITELLAVAVLERVPVDFEQLPHFVCCQCLARLAAVAQSPAGLSLQSQRSGLPPSGRNRRMSRHPVCASGAVCNLFVFSFWGPATVNAPVTLRKGEMAINSDGKTIKKRPGSWKPGPVSTRQQSERKRFLSKVIELVP
jgi:hypothetical protein